LLDSLIKRFRGKYRRALSAVLCRRPVEMKNTVSLISFTFDDFPRSALEVGGKILRAHGVAGTYYVSLGLLNRDEPTGRICSSADLTEVLAQGHELGCHTFGHCDAWETDSFSFEESIMANRLALQQTLPKAGFLTMSYPISMPRPDTKRRTGQHFLGCRGGGQRFNLGIVDLNYLQAFFIEQSRDAPGAIWEMIDRNRVAGGWLIFATHDVTSRPTRFGCTPEFFDEVVRRAVISGSTVLPVAQALSIVCGHSLAQDCQK
jgi:peptidoglycan/xylan/chitin deacetylase (PgdA/CDA1 family)